MATRYVAKRDQFLVDRQGKKRFFKRNNIRRDGTVGYTPDELKGLSRDQLRMFVETTVDGEGVEQATAAPGEKRSVRRSREEDSGEESEADSE
jgi:hypothetical protein